MLFRSDTKTAKLARIFILSSIVLVGGIVTALLAGKSTENLITNGGLESSTAGSSIAEGWISFANGEKNSAKFSVTNEQAHEGANSFKIEIIAADGVQPWDIVGGPSGISVKPSKRYHFSGWFKGTQGSKIEISVNLRKEPWTLFGSSREQLLSGDWQKIAFDIAAGNTHDILAAVQLNYTQNTGKTIYVDDLRLVQMKH